MANGWDQRVCLAAAFFIAERTGADRSAIQVVQIPEDEEGAPGQKVELICSIGGEEVALEHTQVESFEQQIQDGHHINDFIRNVTGRLTKGLPAGTFTLGVATDAMNGLTGTKGDEAAAELAAWIDENVQAIVNGYDYEDPTSHSRPIEAGIEGRIWFRPGEAPRTLQFARATPDPLEEKRVERIKKAYDTKLPKLSAESEKGRSRCLVLENCDNSLGNSMLIRSAALIAAKDYHDTQPEWLMLVETDIKPAEWLVLASNGEWPEFDPSESTPIEIPEDLNP